MNLMHYMKRTKKKLAIFWGRQPKNEMRTADGTIAYYDWHECNAETAWFTRFIRKHFPRGNYKLNFYGVCGNGRFLRNQAGGKKIFFSGENLDRRFSGWNWKFGDYGLPYVDLAMGFADRSDKNYLRFPLWIMYVFSPEADTAEIRCRIQEINDTRYPKEKLCALIAGHDKHGTRKMIFDGVKDLFPIECAGRWNHNTEDLWERYENNKMAYLRNFKFNICPENINTKFYVTEKLFEAFMADSIPIYYGADYNPEPEVVNLESVIFWNADGNNAAARDLIAKLKEDETAYRTFMARPKLLPSSISYVCDAFEQLRSRLQKIIES